MAIVRISLLVAVVLIAAAAPPAVQGQRALLAAGPRSASSATFAPSNDDSSTIENAVTFLNTGKGTPTAKHAARSAISRAAGKLGTPTAKAQATTNPSNDDASIIEHSVTALESRTGTPSQNAKASKELTAAAGRLAAAAKSTGK